ncbi:MAG TPA: MFS transporter, partial [Abditibacteriaceae bacterium]|nr:MFS transporter [Abditibacteriaceae bacterium]
GTATSMNQLIFFRVVQGLGAGTLLPIGMTIIGDIYTVEERARMQAVFSSVWAVSSIVGPLAGGFITDHLSWRWVFLINVPFGIAAAFIIGFALKEAKRDEHPTVDYTGAVILTAAITLLMLAFDKGSGAGASLLSARNLALFAGAAVLFVIFARVEQRVKDPIVPFDLFHNRVVTVAVLAGFLAGMAMFGAISFVPLYAQGALGTTASTAGSMLTPLMLSWVVLSIVGGRLMLKIGARPTVITGVSLMTLGFVLLSTYHRDMPRMWLMTALGIIGAGLGLTMFILLLAVQQSVPRSRLGLATSLNLFARSIGGAFGVAVMGAVLSAGLADNLNAVARAGKVALTPQRAAELAQNPNDLMEPAARAALAPDLRDALQGALAAALHNVFLIGAGVAALALIVVFWLPRPGQREESTASLPVLEAEHKAA